jgi:hypothetical protein
MRQNNCAKQICDAELHALDADCRQRKNYIGPVGYALPGIIPGPSPRGAPVDPPGT